LVAFGANILDSEQRFYGGFFEHTSQTVTSKVSTALLDYNFKKNGRKKPHRSKAEL